MHQTGLISQNTKGHATSPATKSLRIEPVGWPPTVTARIGGPHCKRWKYVIPRRVVLRLLANSTVDVAQRRYTSGLAARAEIHWTLREMQVLKIGDTSLGDDKSSF